MESRSGRIDEEVLSDDEGVLAYDDDDILMMERRGSQGERDGLCFILEEDGGLSSGGGLHERSRLLFFSCMWQTMTPCLERRGGSMNGG